MAREDIYKLIELSRYNPVLGAEILFGIKLPLYQQDMLLRFWNTKRVIFLCSRRTGKTFIMTLGTTMKACLYPYTRVAFTAPVFRQAQTLFLEFEDLVKKSPFLRSQIVGDPSHGNAEWYCNFSNGSRLSALPLSDNIRSKGFNIIVNDEFSYGKNMITMTDRILSPMLFTKRSAKTGGKQHATEIGNQLVIASTASFRFNDYYQLVCDYQKKIDEGDPNYDIISYDYRDGLSSGLFEEDLVISEYNSVDPITRKMEFLNIFPEDSEGFITYELLHNKCIDTDEVKLPNGEVAPLTRIEFEQPYDEDGFPTDRYVMAIDDSEQGTDRFAIALYKLDGNTKRLVRVITREKVHIQEKIKLIRDLLCNFEIVLITCDQRHQNIKDALMEEWTDDDGIKHPVIVDKDDPEQLEYVFNKYGENVDYRSILKIHNFSANTNELRARHCLNEIEKGRLKIPAPIRVKNKVEEEAYNEIKMTMAEMVSIMPQASGKYITYKPSGNQKDDRWTVVELGCYMADEYIKETTGADDSNLVLGTWV